MKKLKLYILPLVVLSLVCCSRPVVEGKAPDALLFALEKVALVDGDDDARNGLTVKLSRQAARVGAFQEAIKAAGQISGAKRGATFALVGWEAACRGFHEQAKDAVHLAEEDKWICTDDEAGLKYAYIAGTFEQLGMHREAEKYIHKILDSKMLRLADSLCATAKITKNMDFQKYKMDDFTTDTVSEAVQGLIPVLENPKIELSKKRDLLGLFHQMIQLSYPPSKVECWSRIAEACGEQNLVGDAAILARQALDFAQGFDPKLEMYAVGLSQTSMAFSAANEKDEAVHCLELAAVRPQIIASFFQPEALCAIAKGYQKAGEPEKANQYWLKAIQIAKSHPHPRARQINVVILLSSMAEVGAFPSSEIMAVIDSIARGEGGDAPLPPGYVRVGDTKSNAVTAPAKQDKKEKKDKKDKRDKKDEKK